MRNILRGIAGVVIAGLLTDNSSGQTPANFPQPAPWSGFIETNFPFFSSTVDARKLGDGLSSDNLTPRGIVLNLGHDCWACFDTDLLRMSAIWRGRAVSPVSMSQISYLSPGTKAIEGEEHLPQIEGAPWLANGVYPGWQAGERFTWVDPRAPCPDPKEVGRGPLPSSLSRFKGLRLTENGLCLEYEAGGTGIREWVEACQEAGQPFVRRHFQIDKTYQSLWLALGKSPASRQGELKTLVVSERKGARPVAERVETPEGLFLVRVSPSEEPVSFDVNTGPNADLGSTGRPEERSVDRLQPARWPETLITHGLCSSSNAPFVVDSIPLPETNPWRRNIRLADIAFLSAGRAAAVTFDGDVWMISGLAGNLEDVTWRRFASGLHEPLSIGIRSQDIFVFDRNGIWRLLDKDGNGEADLYELYSNAFAQTAETRDYAATMKIAPDGSFVIGKGGIQMSTLGKDNGTVMRVSPDGRDATVLAWGLRTPFLGIHPETGLITASDQQGNYVPTTPLHIIEGHQFYGFLSNRLPAEQYPAPIAEPLTWIPYPINASGASQVWLTHAKMGPLNEALIHLGYYRPEVFVVRLHQRSGRLQAAVLSVTRNLEFAPLNGAVNPADGQLYVTGFQIFGTTAKQISGLARIRYTGAPSALPKEIIAMDRGVLVRFEISLNAGQATDPGNFSAERWQYRRTSSYGSPHFKLDGSKGQEFMTPSSAYVSKDRRSVFIGIPDMKPVMQMRVGWALARESGEGFEQNAYLTPHELVHFDPVSEGFEALTVDLTPRIASQTLAVPPSAEEGRRTSELMGCIACHSIDGSILGKVGPTWKGLWGSEVNFKDGSHTVADAAYVRESILNPAARVVRDFDKADAGMPSYEGVISDAQIEGLVLYLQTLR